MFVESENGHETVDVPQDKVPEVVKEELGKDKWVSAEKGDGKVELLTKKDLPEENTAENMAWAEKFENVKSITSTNPAKGG